MSAPKFTPGPWRWDSVYWEGRKIAEHLVTDHRPVTCNDPLIFSLREDWIGKQSEDREAAKKLIAAAPEMYEALRAIVELHDRGHIEGLENSTEGETGTLRAARSALGKAGGE